MTLKYKQTDRFRSKVMMRNCGYDLGHAVNLVNNTREDQEGKTAGNALFIFG